MHGINYQRQQQCQRIHPYVSILHYHSNIDIWWACQGEKIFDSRFIIWTNAILKHILGMEILAWYIVPNGIENTNVVEYLYPIGFKKT